MNVFRFAIFISNRFVSIVRVNTTKTIRTIWFNSPDLFHTAPAQRACQLCSRGCRTANEMPLNSKCSTRCMPNFFSSFFSRRFWFRFVRGHRELRAKVFSITIYSQNYHFIEINLDEKKNSFSVSTHTHSHMFAH